MKNIQRLYAIKIVEGFEMKKWSKVLVSAVMMGSMVFAAGCGNDKNEPAQTPAANNDQPAQTEKTTYVVGTNPTFQPFEYQDEDGNMVGFDLELIKAIGEDQGFDVEYKSLEFDALVAEVGNGSIDIIASGMSITPKRLQEVDFSDPYIDASLSVVVAADNEEITGVDSLKGKVVAAQIGTTGAEQCLDLQKQGIIADAKILQDYDLCFLELGNGGVDAVINDIPVTQAFMAKNPGQVKMVGDSLADDKYGFAVAKGNAELADKISAGLANVKESGVYDELLIKYINGEGAPEAAPADDAEAPADAPADGEKTAE